jgi:hypothetical protein
LTTDVLALLKQDICKAGHLSGLFTWQHIAPISKDEHMTQTPSKSRERAEIAFARTQTEFFSRGAAVAEMDSIVAAREAKTQRLREARLAKEVEDQAAAQSAMLAKLGKTN